MPESLTVLLYRHPNFFRRLGGTILKLGCIGLIAGAFAHAGKLTASIATGVADQPPVTDIARLLPGVWTWWIPETFAGVAVYVALAGIGACLQGRPAPPLGRVKGGSRAGQLK